MSNYFLEIEDFIGSMREFDIVLKMSDDQGDIEVSRVTISREMIKRLLGHD